MPPKSFRDILDSGLRTGKDFQARKGNLENLARCLLAAPHGGGIECGTTEILRAVARLGGWAYYHFDGKLRSGNWERLHIASTLFDEPGFRMLLPRTNFVVSFHGAGESENRKVYVGGLYRQGREIFLCHLQADLAGVGIRAVDALASRHAEEIAGRSQRNITNRGKLGAGVQLELSRGAREMFFRSLSRDGRRQPTPALDTLAQSIDRALRELIGQ